jgi:hypothetical protein
LERRARRLDLGRRLRLRPELDRDGTTSGVIAAGLALVAALAHAATAWRYGYFRDELYFIACSKHLAWGYVDQPPLVAVAAWLAGPLGYPLVALRALPVLAAALTVYLAVSLARELGGGTFAQLLAGVATLLLPAYLLLGNTLATTSFEPLSWTLAVYAAIRIVRAPSDTARRRWWCALGALVAVGAYGKYSIGLLVGALAIGIALTPQRRIARSAWLLVAAAIAAFALAPNIAWQGAHGWPIVEVLRGDAAHRPAFANGIALESLNLLTNARFFALEQLLYTNPLAAPVWIAGIVAPWRLAVLRDLRFASIAYLALFFAAAALAAKGYYIIGIYASLLAIGSVALERAARPLRAVLFAALAAAGLAALPLSLPVLPVDALVAYSKALGLTGHAGPPHLVQPVFAEEFGWRRLARDVATVYFSLPPAQRAQTAIYADTYGDAGALDFFGPAYGLPAVISSQNSYYLWGTRGYQGRSLIAIGATRIDRLRAYYRSVTLVRTSSEPYKWIVEGPAPIYLCRDPVAPLAQIWPNLRWFGA